MPKLGRELIEDGLKWLYDRFQAEKVTPVFATLTLPTRYEDGQRLTWEEERHLLARWSEIVKRYFEEVMRELGRLGLPQRFLYVVELQKRLFPHLHAVLPNRMNRARKGRPGGWALSFTINDRIWARVLSNELGKPVDIRSACNMQPIHGMSQLVDYMTKVGRIGRYMSKGSKEIHKAREAGLPLPSSWYGADLDTKQQVRASVLAVQVENTSVHALGDAIDQVEATLGRNVFSKPFLVTKDGLDWYISALTQVRNLRDISIAFAHLLPLICDTS